MDEIARFELGVTVGQCPGKRDILRLQRPHIRDHPFDQSERVVATLQESAPHENTWRTS